MIAGFCYANVFVFLFLVDILSTKDLLMGILQRYKDLMENNPATHVEEPLTKNSLNSNVTLTNTRAAASSTTTTSNTDILSELLGGAISSTNSSPKVEQQKVTKDNGHTALDELTEIFGCIDTTKTEQTKYPSDLLGNFDLLEPINVFGSETKNSTTTTEKSDINEECEKQKPQGFKELREIDKLSEEIFKQSLQSEQRQTTFKKYVKKCKYSCYQDSCLNCFILGNQKRSH